MYALKDPVGDTAHAVDLEGTRLCRTHTEVERATARVRKSAEAQRNVSKSETSKNPPQKDCATRATTTAAGRRSEKCAVLGTFPISACQEKNSKTNPKNEF